MLLTDSKISELVEKNGIIENYIADSLTNIGYDLAADHFITSDGKQSSLDLKPLESAFVASKENIKLPADIAARIVIKNSRLRAGLTLDAPLYQPGHHTKVFFRLTNMSSDTITLKSGAKYATVTLEQLGEAAAHPYDGTFSEEMDYNGLGAYKDLYAEDIKKIEKKTEDLKSIEKNIYSNVLVILTVFVALFSFLSTNITLAVSGAGNTKVYFMYNVLLLGGISFLLALLSQILDTKGKLASILMTIAALAAEVFIYFMF